MAEPDPTGRPPWMDAVDRDLREGGVERFLTPANGGPPITPEQISERIRGASTLAELRPLLLVICENRGRMPLHSVAALYGCRRRQLEAELLAAEHAVDVADERVREVGG